MTREQASTTGASGKIAIRIGVAVVLVGAAVFAYRLGVLGSLQALLMQLLEDIRGLGALGVVLFFVVYVIAAVLAVPGSILTMGAGFLFGVVMGSIWVSAASTTAATCAFLIGRYFLRDRVARRIESMPKFKAIDEAVAEEGWKIVLLSRLSPALPFTLLNYGYGLTKVSLKEYLVASWVGMLPATVMYVYIGSLAQDLTTLGAGGRVRTTEEWVLFYGGLAATVLVTLYVTRIARRALSRKVADYSA